MDCIRWTATKAWQDGKLTKLWCLYFRRIFERRGKPSLTHLKISSIWRRRMRCFFNIVLHVTNQWNREQIWTSVTLNSFRILYCVLWIWPPAIFCTLRPQVISCQDRIWRQWRVIAETEPYFEAKIKSCYKNGFGNLEELTRNSRGKQTNVFI